MRALGHPRKANILSFDLGRWNAHRQSPYELKRWGLQMWGDKQSMLIVESLENTRKQKEKEKPHIPPPPPQDSLVSSTCCFTQWKPHRTYRGTWPVHRWKMIWRERFDSIWSLTTGWFHCFSNVKKISLLRSLNMNFKETHKSSTKILLGGNELFCTFVHLCIFRGGRDSFSNSPHIEFPLWNSLTVLSKC